MRSTKLTRVLLILILSASAFAADLKNADGVKYKIKIFKDGRRVETTIDGGTTIAQICDGRFAMADLR